MYSNQHFKTYLSLHAYIELGWKNMLKYANCKMLVDAKIKEMKIMKKPFLVKETITPMSYPYLYIVGKGVIFLWIHTYHVLHRFHEIDCPYYT